MAEAKSDKVVQLKPRTTTKAATKKTTKTKTAKKPAAKKSAPKTKAKAKPTKTAAKKVATAKKAAKAITKKKSTAAKPAAKKPTVKKAATKKVAAKKTVAKKATAKKVAKPANKKPAVKAAKKTVKKVAKPKTAAKKTVAKKSVAKKVAPKTAPKVAALKLVSTPQAKPQIKKTETIIMTQPNFEQAQAQFDQFTKEAANINREGIDAIVKSGTIFAKGFESIIRTSIDLAQTNAEKQMQLAKDAMTSKTINEFSDAQNKLAQTSFDDFMSGTTKITELGVKIVTEAIEPINDQIAKSVQKATDAVAAE